MKSENNRRKKHVWRRPAKRGDALILIGMPGCGKSTLGRRLARRYNKRFIDVDDVLVAQEGKSVAELAASLRFEEFVQRECRAVCSIKDSTAIIATGGSVIYSSKSMTHLANLGTIVYLQKPIKETRRRAGDPRKRGIVVPPKETYQTYQKQRHRLYRRYADIIYETADTTVYQSLLYLQALLEFVDPETFVAKEAKQENRPRPRRRRNGDGPKRGRPQGSSKPRASRQYSSKQGQRRQGSSQQGDQNRSSPKQGAPKRGRPRQGGHKQDNPNLGAMK